MRVRLSRLRGGLSVVGMLCCSYARVDFVAEDFN